MKNTLLTAAAIALALGMEDKQKPPKGKIIPENSSAVGAAIQTARKEMEKLIDKFPHFQLKYLYFFPKHLKLSNKQIFTL